MIATQEHKQIKFEQINNPDILRKKRLLREEELTPEKILEAVGMQSPKLLELISDSNKIRSYVQLEKGMYSCHYNGCRMYLRINNYNRNTCTCASLDISKKDYSTSQCEEISAYMQNNELKIEKR